MALMHNIYKKRHHLVYLASSSKEGKEIEGKNKINL